MGGSGRGLGGNTHILLPTPASWLNSIDEHDFLMLKKFSFFQKPANFAQIYDAYTIFSKIGTIFTRSQFGIDIDPNVFSVSCVPYIFYHLISNF
jgi:hypothetical protein